MAQRSWWRREFTVRRVFFYVLFHGLHIGLFVFGWYVNGPGEALARRNADAPSRWKQASDARLAGLNTLTFSVWLSRGAGLVLSVDGTLILLPMCKIVLRYIRPKIRWLPLDESQWFHRQVAYSLLLWTIVHVSAHYVK
jgi:NADPH oxidase